MKNFIVIVLTISLLVLASLACNLPTTSTPPAEDNLAVPTLPMDVIESTLQSGYQVDPNTGNVTFTVTEQEMTAYLANEVAGNSDAPIQEPQVFLRNGQIDLYGVASQGVITANVHIVMVPFITPDHLVQVQITSAEYGPVTLPDSVLSSLTNTINNTLAKEYSSAQTGVNAESVVVSNGTMTITGTPAQ